MVPTRKSIINNPKNARAIESPAGKLVLVNNTTIQWYSKRQDTVEVSTHEYEHVARAFLRNNAYLRKPLKGLLRHLSMNRQIPPIGV